MNLVRHVVITFTASVLFAMSAVAAPLLEEHVTGGALDLPWLNGFGVSANMQPATLAPGHPAFANPSGDHTVAVATTMPPDSGGIVLSATEPAGLSDYEWEAWIFTGDGNSRRGLVVRADPTNGFASNYQLVIQSGLLQMNFRKLLNGSPTTLGSWFTNTLPGGVPAVNSWHHMKVVAQGSQFRCFWDGTELTAAPIVDSDLAIGWVGVYNFRFDIGGIPFYSDDLLLSPLGVTPTVTRSWGQVKALFR
jgi:hypothetical protein